MFLDYHSVTGRDMWDDMDADQGISYTGGGSPPDPLFYFTKASDYHLTPVKEVGKATKFTMKSDASIYHLPVEIYVPTSLIRYKHPYRKRKGEPYIHTEFLKTKLKEIYMTVQSYKQAVKLKEQRGCRK